MLAMRQILLGPRGAKLPYDAEVEYLEKPVNVGSYIDTGIFGGSDISYEIGAICTSQSNNYWLGAWVNNYSSLSFCVGKDGGANKIFTAYNSGGTKTMDSDYFAVGNHVVVTQANGVFAVNGIVVSTRTSATFSTSPYSIYLFAQNRGGTLFYMGDARIAYCKIWDDNVLVRDYIPVRFTNELGQPEGAMYDRVSGQLFRNQGTGAFLYGNDK